MLDRRMQSRNLGKGVRYWVVCYLTVLADLMVLAVLPTPNDSRQLRRHFLKGRSLKGRCNIRVYVPVCVCVCVFLCVSPSSPALTPPILWG